MIIIGADHGGFELKEKVKSFLQRQYSEPVVDIGAFKVDDNDDFSYFAKSILKCFDNDKTAKIIAFCGSGVGMSIALNKHKGVFCAVGYKKNQVEKARQHNNINAIALGGRVTKFGSAKKMVKAFLETEFLGGKYQKRMKEIDK